MDALGAIGCLAIASSFACGLLLMRKGLLMPRLRRPAAALGSDGLRAGRAASLLRNGAPVGRRPARAALRLRAVKAWAQDAADLCVEKGFATSPEALLSVAFVGLAALGAVAGVAAWSPVAAAAVPLCAAALLAAAVRAARDAREDAVRESVPEALRSMEACFQAGYTLSQTFEQVAQETSGSLRAAFLSAAHLLETGRPASEALAQLRESGASSELSFVAVALQVQHEAGGSMRQVLEAARATVEGELELKRSLRVHTAQAKLSACIVSVMPVVLVALFSLVSEGFLQPFFASPTGWALLALALGMQLAGIAMVRRMLNVEIAL